MDETFFTSGEAAETVGIPRSRFLYLVERGDLPAPSHAVPGCRLFTAEDLERIKVALARLAKSSSDGRE